MQLLRKNSVFSASPYIGSLPCAEAGSYFSFGVLNGHSLSVDSRE